MTRIKLLDLLRFSLVSISGALISWNISFFRPFTAFYPPKVTYSITDRLQAKPDCVLASPGLHYERNRFEEFWFGKHYRFLWTQPVKVKVLDLEKEHDSLQILRRGGGMQTTSFTLEDATGNEFALRSVDKNPMGVLPELWWPTVVSAFVRDQISATDPFASQLITELSAKAGIPYVPARLFFVLPEDKVFRKFKLQNGGFYNLSRKLPELETLQKQGENYAGAFSSEEMAALLDKPNSRSKIDTMLYLKCRLFDLLIGDWDRHAGQWDWLAFSTPTDTVFRPFPKDRDQAFGYYQDGVFPYLFTRKFVVRKISSFTPEYEDMEGYTQNGSVLDDRYLKNVKQQTFEVVSRQLQTSLPDRDIASAMRKYPKVVYSEIGPRNYEVLKARRDRLPEAANAFYKVIKERNQE